MLCWVLLRCLENPGGAYQSFFAGGTAGLFRQRPSQRQEQPHGQHQCQEQPCGQRWGWPQGQEWLGPGVATAILDWERPRGQDCAAKIGATRTAAHGCGCLGMTRNELCLFSCF